MELFEVLASPSGATLVLHTLFENDNSAFYHPAALEAVEAYRTRGWVVTTLSPTGKTRYSLSDAIRTRSWECAVAFGNELQKSATKIGTSPDVVYATYERISLDHRWNDFESFDNQIVAQDEFSDRELLVLGRRAFVLESKLKNPENHPLVRRGYMRFITMYGKKLLVPSAKLFALYSAAEWSLEPERQKRRRSKERAAAAARARRVRLKAASVPQSERVKRVSIWRGLLPDDVAQAQESREASDLCLRMELAGLSRTQIAVKLGVSVQTVRNRVRKAKEKQRYRTPLVAYLADREGYTALEPLKEVLDDLAVRRFKHRKLNRDG